MCLPPSLMIWGWFFFFFKLSCELGQSVTGRLVSCPPCLYLYLTDPVPGLMTQKGQLWLTSSSVNAVTLVGCGARDVYFISLPSALSWALRKGDGRKGSHADYSAPRHWPSPVCWEQWEEMLTALHWVSGTCGRSYALVSLNKLHLYAHTMWDRDGEYRK